MYIYIKRRKPKGEERTNHRRNLQVRNLLIFKATLHDRSCSRKRKTIVPVALWWRESILYSQLLLAAMYRNYNHQQDSLDWCTNTDDWEECLCFDSPRSEVDSKGVERKTVLMLLTRSFRSFIVVPGSTDTSYCSLLPCSIRKLSIDSFNLGEFIRQRSLDRVDSLLDYLNGSITGCTGWGAAEFPDSFIKSRANWTDARSRASSLASRLAASPSLWFSAPMNSWILSSIGLDWSSGRFPEGKIDDRQSMFNTRCTCQKTS